MDWNILGATAGFTTIGLFGFVIYFIANSKKLNKHDYETDTMSWIVAHQKPLLNKVRLIVISAAASSTVFILALNQIYGFSSSALEIILLAVIAIGGLVFTALSLYDSDTLYHNVASMGFYLGMYLLLLFIGIYLTQLGEVFGKIILGVQTANIFILSFLSILYSRRANGIHEIVFMGLNAICVIALTLLMLLNVGN